MPLPHPLPSSHLPISSFSSHPQTSISFSIEPSSLYTDFLLLLCPFFSVNFYFKNTPLPSSPTFSSSHPSSNPVTVSLSLSSLSTFLHPFCLFPSPLSVPLCCILLGAGVIFFFPFWILDSRFTQFSELFLNNKCFKV